MNSGHQTLKAARNVTVLESPARMYTDEVAQGRNRRCELDAHHGWLHVREKNCWRELYVVLEIQTLTMTFHRGHDAASAIDVICLDGQIRASLSGKVALYAGELVYGFKIVSASGKHKSEQTRCGVRSFAAKDNELAIAWVRAVNRCRTVTNSKRLPQPRRASERRLRNPSASGNATERTSVCSPVDTKPILAPIMRNISTDDTIYRVPFTRTLVRPLFDRQVAIVRLQKAWRGHSLRLQRPQIFWRQTYKKLAFECVRKQVQHIAVRKIQKWARFWVLRSTAHKRYREALFIAYLERARRVQYSFSSMMPRGGPNRLI